MCLRCDFTSNRVASGSRRHFLKFAGAATAGLVLPTNSLAQKAPPKPANNVSPDGALKLLMDGNRRYIRGVTKRHDFKHEREALTKGQNPDAGILSCADSRIAPEYAFAPMEATNGWGSTLGLLTPFFILSWLLAPSVRRRTIGWTIAALALVPLVISTNRGAWLSIAVALIYFAARRAFRGDARPLFAIVMLGTLVFACVLFTPLAGVVSTRLDQSDVSDADRGNLYTLAFEKTQDSPFVGYGAPQSEDSGFPIGTHGLFWYVMFSHGFVGLGFLLAAMVVLTASTAKARTPTAMWAHICIVIALTQVPYYGLLPQFVLVGVAAGICWREDHPQLAALELH